MLDVQMPGLTGFEVARRVMQSGLDTQVVFVTAFDQYAIDAFEVNAVDYLLKPVDPERLTAAVDRARKRHAGPPQTAQTRTEPDPPRAAPMDAHPPGGRGQRANTGGERGPLGYDDAVVPALA